MRDYARQQVSSRLARLVFELRRAVRHGDPDGIHDLRVAIRRFSEGLRVFRDFFPRREAKRIRRRLRSLMDFAAEVRNRDITLDLCRQAGGPPGCALAARLAKERAEAVHALTEAAKRLMQRNVAARWRSRLEL